MQKLILMTIMLCLPYTVWAFTKKSESVHTTQSKVALSNDAIEEQIDGEVIITSSDLEMVRENEYPQIVGLRFTDVDVPYGAHIVHAYIRFTVDEPTTEETFLAIYAQDHVNPPFFINTPYNVSSRKRVADVVRWHVPAWKYPEVSGLNQKTPELKNLIQPIVSKEGWKRGNAIAFIISGTGKRVAKSYIDDDPAHDYSPVLHIAYRTETNSTIPHKPHAIPQVTHQTQPIDTGLYISEILACNANTNIDPDNHTFEDWIELFNDTNRSIDLKGYYLSNDPDAKQWFRIEADSTIAPHGYRLVWCDGTKTQDKKKALHTDFKLSKKSGVIWLADSKGRLIEKRVYGKQKCDIASVWKHGKMCYTTPTPGATNSQQCHAKAKRTAKPIFSKEGGLYEHPFKLCLKHRKKKASIYYTLDGSTPTANSPRYIHQIDINQTTVVRAVAKQEGKFVSKVVTHTFLMYEKSILPIVSLAIDNRYLDDQNIGIAANYDERWLRPAHLEYFEKGELGFSKNIGLKISGNHTRWYPQKSFAVIVKKRYAKKPIEYPLFHDKPNIKKVKSFLLRNSGTFWGESLIREGIQHRIVMHLMDIDCQAYQPAILYLNGRYWGIYNIREKMNESYIRTNHPVKKTKIDLIENDEVAKEGDLHDFQRLVGWIKTHDMKNPADFQKAIAYIDLDEFINHLIVESFVGNSSIHHNIKRWKIKGPQGRWRSMLMDVDRGFGEPTDKVLGYIADSDPTSMFFTYFLQNNWFVQRFASRYFTHLNTTFQPERIAKIITEAKNTIAPEVPRHFKRWPKDQEGNQVSPESWHYYVDRLYHFATKRNDIVRHKLRKAFDLKGKIHLNIIPSEYGKIFLDGVAIESDFKGIYFTHANVELKAVPNRGYRFVHWSNGIKENEMELLLSQDMNITASFVATEKDRRGPPVQSLR